jgi:hypothetical protein
MKKVFVLVSLASFFVVTPLACFAQMANQGDVIINEITWMGSTNSANDEWIELKNTTDKDITLSSWVLKTSDEKIKINLTGSILAQGFYLLERTDDNTVPSITADTIYKGSLNNTGQYLKLYDSSNNLIDQGDFSLKWPAGDNTTKQTMEKTLTGWQTSKKPGGTPKVENSSGAIIENSKSQTPASNQTENSNSQKIEASDPTPSIEHSKTDVMYSRNVIINELLPSPEGADDTQEWIEIYNNNATTVDVSNWKLQDNQGTPTMYVFAKNTVLPAYEYLVIKRLKTHITLNNDQDKINLMWPNETIIDSVSYTKAPNNKSYNKTDSGWQWSTTVTPGTKNSITSEQLIVKNKKTSSKILPKTTKTDNTYLSALSEPTSNLALFSEKLHSENNLNPWWLFIIASGITIIFATIILLLKIKVFRRGNTIPEN